MLHDFLITIHTIGASIAFFTGGAMLYLLVRNRSVFFWLVSFLLVTLALMILPLVAVIGVDWPELETGARIIFPALGALDIYMFWRAWKAHRMAASRPVRWQFRFTDHVGFVLISLWAGFIIVLAIDLGAPTWAVVIIAILSILAGIFIVNRIKSRVPVEIR